MKLATFKSGGQEKVGIVHSRDARLFDLAAAASRQRQCKSGLCIDAGV